jgi:hypothetical protein
MPTIENPIGSGDVVAVPYSERDLKLSYEFGATIKGIVNRHLGFFAQGGVRSADIGPNPVNPYWDATAGVQAGPASVYGGYQCGNEISGTQDCAGVVGLTLNGNYFSYLRDRNVNPRLQFKTLLGGESGFNMPGWHTEVDGVNRAAAFRLGLGVDYALKLKDWFYMALSADAGIDFYALNTSGVGGKDKIWVQSVGSDGTLNFTAPNPYGNAGSVEPFVGATVSTSFHVGKGVWIEPYVRGFYKRVSFFGGRGADAGMADGGLRVVWGGNPKPAKPRGDAEQAPEPAPRPTPAPRPAQPQGQRQPAPTPAPAAPAAPAQPSPTPTPAPSGVNCSGAAPTDADQKNRWCACSGNATKPECAEGL